MNEQQKNEIRSLSVLSKYKRKKLFSALAVILLAAILVAVNLLSGLLPWKILSPSLGDDAVFGLSSATKTLLSDLEEDVTLYMLCENGETNVDRDLLSFLKNYESLSPRISVQVIDSKNDSEFLSSHGIEGLSEGAVCFVVESDRRYVLLSLSDLYYYHHKSDEIEFYYSPAEYASAGEQLSALGYTMTPYFNGEEGITNAIRTVTKDKVPVVAIVQSAYLSESGELISLNAETNTILVQSLRQNGCDIRYIVSVSELSSEHDMLLFNSPLIDLSKQEKNDLSDWLDDGGDMLLTTYFGNAIEQPNLAAVLNEYGLSADEKNVKITEGDSSYAQGGYHLAMVGKHQITTSLTESIIASDAHAIYTTPKDDVDHTRLLYTTSLGSRQKYHSDTGTWENLDEEKSTYTYGVVAEKEDSKIIWISTPFFLDMADSFSKDGNYQLLHSSIEWLTNSSLTTIDTEANSMASDVLQVSTTAFLVWLVILVLLIPLAAISIGLIRRHLRKNG